LAIKCSSSPIASDAGASRYPVRDYADRRATEPSQHAERRSPFTILLLLIVSFSGIKYKVKAVAMATRFTVGIVCVLVIARLLD
jgi:hypothetical protein